MNKRYKEWADKSVAVAHAYWLLGMLWPEDIPEIACDALERGLDGEMICIAAGLNSPTVAEVCDAISMNKFWSELGCPEVSGSDVADWLAKHVCELVVSGKMSVQDAADELWNVFAALAYPNSASWSDLARLSDEYGWGEDLSKSRKEKLDKRGLVMVRRIVGRP